MASDPDFSHSTREKHEESIRSVVNFSERRFDVKTLPVDMQRVYGVLAEKFGEEYGLTWVFTMRTAVELHRAWHMTLLTSKILQQLKDRFKIRMTWNLGVFHLKFRVEDGGFELHRKVPYDYDSEYQDIYMRIAVALMDGHINIHEALIFQSETKHGEHTARSGIFLRDFPGRLVLYPGVAATCAMIFFSGGWTEFYIAAICGLATGLVEYTLSILGAGVLNDVCVGTMTGVIAGFFWRYGGEDICISSVLLGTLYWFFYGTAFVLGILEIIAGELETGVTRFIAVSVKTFVLCLGAGFGLLVVGNASEVWLEQDKFCGTFDLDDKAWRIPMYLLCSAFVLGQYRFPIVRYWRALIVMLVGYEVQYQSFDLFADHYGADNLDTAISNVFGAALAVVSACFVSYWVNQLRYYYTARILQKDHDYSCLGNAIYHFMALGVRAGSVVGLGRESDRLKLDMEKKLRKGIRELKDPSHPRETIELERHEENLVIETIVGSQDLNIWSILMPALYQLVPGSMIAKLWFNSIFPPPLIEEKQQIEGTDYYYTVFSLDQAQDNVFSSLMVISTSLALGLIVGFAVVQQLEQIFDLFNCFQDKLKSAEMNDRAKSRRAGMYSAPQTLEDDPDSDEEAEEKEHAGMSGQDLSKGQGSEGQEATPEGDD